MNLSVTLTASSAVVLAMGTFLLIAWWIARRNRISTRTQQQPAHTTASKGGVAVGGNNSGIINTGQINPTSKSANTPIGERLLAVAGSVASIVGLYLVFFPPGVAGK